MSGTFAQCVMIVRPTVELYGEMQTVETYLCRQVGRGNVTMKNCSLTLFAAWEVGGPFVMISEEKAPSPFLGKSLNVTFPLLLFQTRDSLCGRGSSTGEQHQVWGGYRLQRKDRRCSHVGRKGD